MMRAVIRRELIVIAARPGLRVAAALHAGLLAAFLVAWYRGAPVLPGANIYEQQQLVELWLLVALLTWTAARSVAADRSDGMVMLSVLAAVPPSRIVIAKSVALTVALALVLAAGVPLFVIAQQMAAVPLATVVAGTTSLLAIVVMVAAVTVAWTILVSDRLIAWIGSAAMSSLIVIVCSRGPLPEIAGAVVCATAGIAVICAVAGWTDVALRYCHD